ncbi:hypothetical protein EDB81DRAFT_874058 [Dactylonectria macrodidyma]|uniref:Uncharacterized protein n=1 Tax=Dactylonectria macrodidyma TaxID=307937 RepID=A0A9P9JHR5_9HYPO|nr:hypothetical protein EDB81DRAFT_874058 [Dactylonectria macrodidyma]
MLAALRSSWSVTGLVRAVAVLSIATTAVQAITVNDVFVVYGGTEKGGCDGWDIQQWYLDTQTLADAALACINDAIAQKDAGTTDADSQKYLKTFFNINVKTGAFGGHAQALKTSVEEVIAALADDSSDPENDDKPWIFCDSTWAEEKSWDDIAQDEGTGTPNADGKKIKEVYKELYEDNYVKRNAAIDAAKTAAAKKKLPQPFVPFWADAVGLKKYNYDIAGDYASRDNNLAGTDDNFQPNTITFCTKNWADKGWYKSLDAIPAVTEENLSVEKLQPEGLTLFHEMFHFTLLNEHTPDTAYRLSEIVRKNAAELTGKQITLEQSKKNPESFALFALAYELGRRNTAYTFASSASKLL